MDLEETTDTLIQNIIDKLEDVTDELSELDEDEIIDLCKSELPDIAKMYDMLEKFHDTVKKYNSD